MTYYLDLDLMTTGNAGTEGDPWSYADYLAARSTTLIVGDTVKLKGDSVQTERPEVDSEGLWIIWDRWIPTEPWRLVLDCGIIIPSTIGIIMKNGILYNSPEATQALNIGVNGDVPESVEGQEITNMFIVDKVTSPGQDNGLSIHKDWDINFKGCVFFSNTFINLNEPAPSYYDCIFLGTLTSIPAGFTTYNCAFDTPDPSIGSHTEPQWSMPWDDDLLPAWDAPKEDFDSSILFPNITTPPEPGYGAPDYVGYENDLWGNERKGIGCGYFKNITKEKGMSNIKNIVNVTISRETRSVSQAGFGTILIVGENPTFANRINFYTSLSAIADILGADPTTKPEYFAAQAIFSQSPRVTRVAIGRIDDGDTDVKETLDAILDESGDFYGVILADRTLADQTDLVEWVQADGMRICSVASADADIIDDPAETTSIAYVVKSTSADRCTVFYSADAATEYPDAAFLGKILPLTPGSYTGMFKTLSGITVSILTITQTTNAHNKYCSTFENIGGINIVFGSWVGTGEFMDIIVFFDWLVARITEGVYYILVNTKKQPFTDDGILAIKQATEKVLKLGQDNGGISPVSYDTSVNPKIQNGGYFVTAPLSASISANQKALRALEGVEFTAFLAGAIHTVAIQGVLTY